MTPERRRTRAELLAVLRDAPDASSPAARAVLRRNRRRDSNPELRLRRALHALGFRYRVDFPIRCGPGRPIRPDIVFTKSLVAVFVDGCFWHGCPEHGTSPKANSEYWAAKIAINQDRDARQSTALKRSGWLVLRFWEHGSADDAAVQVAAAVSR